MKGVFPQSLFTVTSCIPVNGSDVETLVSRSWFMVGRGKCGVFQRSDLGACQWAAQGWF